MVHVSLVSTWTHQTMTAKKSHIVERACRDCKCISKQPSSCEGDVRLVIRRTFAYTIVAHRCKKHMRNDTIIEQPEELEKWHTRTERSKKYRNRNNILTGHEIADTVRIVPIGHDI